MIHPMEIIINPVAVGAAALATFMIGGLWYSVLFAGKWQQESGVTDAQLKSGALRIFLGSFLFALVMATGLAMLIGARGIAHGALTGVAAGLAFVAAAFGINYLFERKGVALWLINAGYNVISFTVMGVLIGAIQG